MVSVTSRLLGSLVLGSLLVGHVLGGTAHAQSRPEAVSAAREAEADARDAFAAGRFSEAAEHFRKAFALAPSAATKYNEAFAWTKAQQHAQAADAYEAALGFGDLREDLGQASSERLTALRSRLGYLVVSRPLGATVSVAHAARVSIPARIHLPPGEHTVTVSYANGSSEERVLTVTAGATENLTFEAPKIEADDVDDASNVVDDSSRPVPDDSALPYVGWSLLGLGVAGGVVTAVTGSLTLSAVDDYEQSQFRDASLRDEASDLKTVTNVLLIASAAAASTGVVLLLISATESSNEITARIVGPTLQINSRF